MSLENTSFANAIRETAAGLNLVPTTTHVAAIEAILQGSKLSYDDAGHVLLDLGDGSLNATDAITTELNRLRLPTASPAPSVPTSTKGLVGAALRAAQDAKVQVELLTWENPWAGQINRTRQAIIANTNPALATKYRAEAGL